MSIIRGASYRPLGGMHDGGADGVELEGLFESNDSASTFVQVSIQGTVKQKIKDTINRLREVGRDPKQLLYVTNQVVARIDLLEEDLGVRLETAVRVFDANYIRVHLPNDRNLVAAYYQHLHHNTAFLEGIGQSKLVAQSSHIKEPHVYAFLAASLSESGSELTFVDGVVDAMIVFALEGTDPAIPLLRTEAEIRERIIEALPDAESLIVGRLRERLEAISEKGTRRIRWHKKEQRWALPYEERQKLKQSMAEDEALWLNAHTELADRFTSLEADVQFGPDEFAEIALATVRRAFERDGLRFSQFLDDVHDHSSEPFISDSLRESLDAAGYVGELRRFAAENISAELRRMFYDSTEIQRTVLQRISRAYVVAFALRTEPRILKYFDDMMSDTWLYVGSDILVVALSERYLAPSDQHIRNLLKAARVAGAELILAAPVLDEVLNHMRNSDRDYTEDQGYYESLASYELVRHEPKILIRAFLYSQIFEVEGRPNDWHQFIGQFCDRRLLHTEAAVDNLRRYLMTEFSLRFENWRKVHEACDTDRHQELTESLASIKSTEIQASIDAYMFELVLQARANREEEQRSVEFGYQTWWLSAGEGQAVRAMSRVAETTERVLMRPGFLSKYIQLAPSAAQARQQLGSFLPSLLGIRLGRRVTEEGFGRLMNAVRDADAYESGGRAARLASLADEMKSAQYEEFRSHFDASIDVLPHEFA